MPAASTPSKKRAPYTSRACNSCRRRRCKCDGDHPNCGTCLFYGQECSWSKEDDARRPATKQLVESLRMRIHELETENGEFKALMKASPKATSVQLDSTVLMASGDAHDTVTGLTDIGDEHPRKSHLTLQDGGIIASGPTSMWSMLPLNTPNNTGMARPPSETTYQYMFLKDLSIPSEMQPRAVQLSEQCQWDRYLPVINLDVGFTRLEHDTLLHKCFSFHTIWLHAFAPEHFLRDMLTELNPSQEHTTTTQLKKQSLGYSPFLHCALMSLATVFSDNPSIRNKGTRSQFARHAKQHLEDECERPTLAALHALILVSEFHASLGERGLAYLYFGMSCRMSRALGLCIDGRAWVTSGRITQEELVLRDLQFWAIFCQDKVMSVDYGRDFDMPLPHLNVNLPSIDSVSDQKAWDSRIAPSRDYKGHEPSQPSNTTLVFFESCKLMLIAVRIMDTVYSQGRQNWQIVEKDSVPRIHLLLNSWYNNLPTQLAIKMRQPSTPPLPHIIMLNITYWWLLLLLHRPFYTASEPLDVSSNEVSPVSFADLSVKLCGRAANKIVQLVELFDGNYGLRYFPLDMLQTIFMAGATLLVQAATLSASATKARNDAHEATRKCIHALESAGQTWECATTGASHLQRLLQEQTSRRAQDVAHTEDTIQPTHIGNPPSAIFETHPLGSANDANHLLEPPDPNALLSQMFRDAISQNRPDMELGYEFPMDPSLPYSELQWQQQQPLMGMPSGSQFLMNSHMVPLSFDPTFNGGW